MDGLGSCLFGTFDGEAWGFDILCLEERGEILSAVDCDPECLAERPTIRCFGVAVDTLLLQEAGRRLVHRYRVYKDPFPHPALRDGIVPRLLSCVCRAMAIAQLTHLRISIPASGAPPGQVPADCFPGGAPHIQQPYRRRVSFADEVTMLGDAESSVCSPEPESPPLILPVVEEEISEAPVGESIELVPSAPATSLPPPPGFSSFSWPVD